MTNNRPSIGRLPQLGSAGEIPRLPVSTSVLPTVLVVDDDPHITAAADLRLSGSGFRVLTASGGLAAEELAVRHRPAAIVMDLRMPDRDGLLTLRALRARSETAGIPVVIIAATPGSRSLALEAGARFFLAKPYDGQQLVHAIRCSLKQDSAVASTTAASAALQTRIVAGHQRRDQHGRGTGATRLRPRRNNAQTHANRRPPP